MENVIKKTFEPTEYFQDLVVPESWDTLEDFVDWYMASKMPIQIPWNSEVVRTDDATAICLFRKPPYMIELYLIHPYMTIPYHCHPDMEVITMSMGGGSMFPRTSVNTSKNWGQASEKLMPGQYHGGEGFTKIGNGYALLAFEKWLDTSHMISAAVQWKGASAGPIHEKMVTDRYVNRFDKNILIKPGYIDITAPNE